MSQQEQQQVKKDSKKQQQDGLPLRKRRRVTIAPVETPLAFANDYAITKAKKAKPMHDPALPNAEDLRNTVNVCKSQIDQLKEEVESLKKEMEEDKADRLKAMQEKVREEINKFFEQYDLPGRWETLEHSVKLDMAAALRGKVEEIMVKQGWVPPDVEKEELWHDREIIDSDDDEIDLLCDE